MDIHELVRLKRTGKSHTEIGRLLGCRRKTVRKYVSWAGEQGFLDDDLPSAEAMYRRLEETLPQRRPPQQTSTLARHAEEIKAMRERGMEMAAIKVRLEEKHGEPVSYEAVRRLVRWLEPFTPEVFVRVEVEPGSEAQVDFGYAGLTMDPETDRQRKTWVFVMVLSYSRHMYAELVYDQTVETWLSCHRHAFEFFGAVPGRVVPDNLKAAIIQACAHDPMVQRSYREFAEHYDFFIDPQPPKKPRMKGKVEQGGVHYVKRNFLAGRDVEPTDELNAKLLTWCVSVAGERVHGTTHERPVERFENTERAALKPLPVDSYDMAVWKEAKLHRDCHVVFDKAYYSAPYRLVDQALWVRGGIDSVRIYTPEYDLVATHDRAAEPGGRKTISDHLPPEKVPGLNLTRENCRCQAEAIGPSTLQLVEELLAIRPVDKLRSTGRLLALAGRYPPERLERACARALAFGAADYVTVRNILARDLDAEPLPISSVMPSSSERSFAFARRVGEFASLLVGGAT